MGLKLPPLIGVIHLPPLPGAPLARGSAGKSAEIAAARAAEEARVFERAGFDGIIVENFGDAPFYKDRVPSETVAAMALSASAIRASSRLPLGINVLRNDAHSALGIAAATGAQFIRVNVLSGVAATDQGLVEGDAANLVRRRQALRAESVAILADAHVKHARSLSGDDLELAIEEIAGRGGADAVIVTGSTTGRLISEDRLSRASQAARALRIPLYIGSGATLESLEQLRARVDGVIVSSSLRRAGRPGAPLDPVQVRQFARAFHSFNRPARSGTRPRDPR